MEVRVLKIRKVQKGALQAFVDIELEQVEIRGFRVVQQPDQRPWVSVPQNEYIKDGEKRYSNVVVLPDELKRRVQDTILSAWESEG